MEQYIKKSALVAEICKRRNNHFNFGGSPSSEYCHEDDEILGIIDTLEVKEVELESEIENVRKSHFINSDFDKATLDGRNITNIAKHFFELGLQARTDKKLVEEVYSHLNNGEDKLSLLTKDEVEELK